MKLCIVPATNEPIDRIHGISITIRSFKGRRNVEAHLFRRGFPLRNAENFPWEQLISDEIPAELAEMAHEIDPNASKKMICEAFTAEERDTVIAYLQERHGDSIVAINASPLPLPIPQGVAVLSEIPESRTMGFIRFNNVCNYPLPFVVHAFYDLSQHNPLESEPL